MRPVRALASVVLVVAVCLVAGCGSSAPASQDSAPASTAAAGPMATSVPVRITNDDPQASALAREAGITGPVTVSGDPPDVEATAEGASIEITVGDSWFAPAFVHATPGATLHVTLENVGSMVHTFTISALGINEVLDPGGRATVEVAVPEAGSLVAFCRYHRAGGMQGAVLAG